MSACGDFQTVDEGLNPLDRHHESRMRIGFKVVASLLRTGIRERKK